MQLVERHFFKKGDLYYQELDDLCFRSKNLYNKANFLIRKHFKETSSYLQYIDLARCIKNNEDFKSLPAKVSQQTLMILDRNWRVFFKKNKLHKSGELKESPRPPRYLNKQGRFTVVYTSQAIGKNNKLSKTKIFIATKKTNVFQIRIVPKKFGIIVEVVYERFAKEKKGGPHYCSIDLGVNNLATITSDQSNPILINGRIVKSINQYFNKKISRTKSERKKARLNAKRYWRLENYFHHTSKWIVDFCNDHNIGKIIIGHNCGWKNKVQLGKKNNQNFVFVPYQKLIQKISYKAELAGIELILTEESYTSKSSSLDSDPLDGSRCSGKRIKRGLYKSADGFLINADVNGSLNIARKVIDIQVDRSLVARPIKVNPLVNLRN